MTRRRTRKEIIEGALEGSASALVAEGAIKDEATAKAAMRCALKMLDNEYSHEQAGQGLNINQMARSVIQAHAAQLSKDAS